MVSRLLENAFVSRKLNLGNFTSSKLLTQVNIIIDDSVNFENVLKVGGGGGGGQLCLVQVFCTKISVRNCWNLYFLYFSLLLNFLSSTYIKNLVRSLQDITAMYTF